MSDSLWDVVVRGWRAVEQWVEEATRFPSAPICPEPTGGPTDCYLELPTPKEFDTGVRRLFIAEARTFNGVTFRARSIVEFHPNGKVASGVLAEGAAQSIEGHRYASGTPITFWPNGRLMGGTLDGDQRIGNVWFAGKTPKMLIGPMVTFSENGKIFMGRSARNQTIDRVKVKKDDPLMFSFTGKLLQDPPRIINAPYGEPPRGIE